MAILGRSSIAATKPARIKNKETGGSVKADKPGSTSGLAGSICQFGNATERVEKALAALLAGEGVLVVDDEDRENEGDLIYSAEYLTPRQMALMIRECSGIVCLCLTDERNRISSCAHGTCKFTGPAGNGYNIPGVNFFFWEDGLIWMETLVRFQGTSVTIV